MLNQRENGLETKLVYYYGVLQSVHILGLIVSGLWWMINGSLGFLALPPEGGWTQQAIHLLVGTGAVDLVIAIVALVFVANYRRGTSSVAILGSIALTGSVYSAAIYAYGTVRSGAWSAHPFAYSVVAIAFAPMVLLAVVFFTRRLAITPVE